MANDLNDDARRLGTEREVWDAKRRRVLDPNLDRDFGEGGRSLPGDGYFDAELGAQAARRPPLPAPGGPPTPAPGQASAPEPGVGGWTGGGGEAELELDLEAVARTRRPATEARPAAAPGPVQGAAGPVQGAPGPVQGAPGPVQGAPSPVPRGANAGGSVLGVVGVLFGGALGMVVVGLGFVILVSELTGTGPSAIQAALDEAAYPEIGEDLVLEVGGGDNRAPVALDEQPAGSRFTEEGIVLALQAGGWRMLDRTDPTALSSFHYHNYIFADRDATLDVTIYTGRTADAVEELGQNRRDPSIDLRFDHRLVRITPRNDADRFHARRMRDLLERYHALVTSKSP